jgi:hypothetical protein
MSRLVVLNQELLRIRYRSPAQQDVIHPRYHNCFLANEGT